MFVFIITGSTVHTISLPASLLCDPMGIHQKCCLQSFPEPFPFQRQQTGTARPGNFPGTVLLCGHAESSLLHLQRRPGGCSAGKIFGIVPEVLSCIPASILMQHPCKKLQNGTVIPELIDAFRDFSEQPGGSALQAIQPAQKQVDVLYILHESDSRFLIFCTNYAIL